MQRKSQVAHFCSFKPSYHSVFGALLSLSLPYSNIVERVPFVQYQQFSTWLVSDYFNGPLFSRFTALGDLSEQE